MFPKMRIRSMNLLELLFRFLFEPRVVIGESVGVPDLYKVAVGFLHACSVGTVLNAEHMISILALFAVTFSYRRDQAFDVSVDGVAGGSRSCSFLV